MIYTTRNYATNTSYYVCPDQATIDAGQADGYTGVFSVGNETDAQAILIVCQNEYLTACADRFSVNKDTDVTDGVLWQPVDLNTEPDNTDISYEIFDTLVGQYTATIGLDNAKALYAQTQQDFLTFSGLNALIVWETWPTVPTQGLQTL